MEYNVQVVGFDPHVEEEVLVRISGVEIACFMPFGISFEPENDKLYTVSLGLVVFDDIEMEEIHTLKRGFQRIDDSFAYYIRGTFDFDRRMIDAGFDVELEEELIDGLSFFDGKNVQIRIDRINIEFQDNTPDTP